MRRVPTTFVPPLELDAGSKTPMYRQLYDWLRLAIISGQIRPGQRIPSTRTLAAELKISRIPVSNAYDQLLAEGYLEAFAGAGTCVSRSIPDDALPPAGAKGRNDSRQKVDKTGPRRISRRGLALTRLPTQSWLNIVGAFRVSLPALDQFPSSVWSRLVARHSRTSASGLMAYRDAMGHLPLREAIAEYLGAARGVRCDAAQIMITTGSQQGLQLAAQVLLDSKSSVWLEDPGYPSARQAFITVGAKLVPVAVDDEGMKVEEMIRRSHKPRAIYITPSHQYPLGTTMTATRRMLLLNWAARVGAWIIEDDYDSEYRFGSRPIAALQGLDADSRVIYVGTFSKVMFPALRVGYLVIPKDLTGAFCAARDAADVFSATLYQLVLADFIREGHFARHIRRMRVLYMERRKELAKAISLQLGDQFEIVGAEAGMHLVVMLPPGMSDVEVSRRAAQRGVSATPLSTCYLRAPARSGLILGYGGTNPRQIRDAVFELSMSLQKR